MISDPARLRLVYLSRFGISMVMMCYAGALPFLVKAWGMTSVEAGSVQAAYNISYAVSLLLTSWLADKLGAKQIFAFSSIATAVAFAAFAFAARSYESALWLYASVAVAAGGTYGTSLILVSELVPASSLGRAIGLSLAAASLGYLAGTFLVVYVSSTISYQWGLAACTAGPVVAAVAGLIAMRGLRVSEPPKVRTCLTSAAKSESLWNRTAILLTLGYTAHCWELLGMWAWTPAFLATALKGRMQDASVLAFWIAASLHLGGAVATATMGPASDRWGRRSMLVAMAALGAILSLGYGWLVGQSAAVMLSITFAYSFAVLGDSGVLSAAMTEAVPRNRLGTALAFRSVFGFGAGALSPLAFGWILDTGGAWHGNSAAWGWAFLSLGFGGIIATACALAIGKPGSRQGKT